MSRLDVVLLSAAVALSAATPAAAQIAGHPLELSGTAGSFVPDGRDRMESGPSFGGALGWRAQAGLTLEAQATFNPSHADTAPGQRHNFTYGGIDLRWNLLGASERVVPFVLTGIGYGLSHDGGSVPQKLERGAGSLGLGVLVNVRDQRTYVRLQVRDMWFRGRNATEFSNRWSATAGIQWTLGGKPRDTDYDGVRDWLDRCPDTPVGAKVDANGCPLDSDGDGVYDGLDQCPGTPKGCTIDSTGCPVDSDGDGACDGLDQCADTPRSAKVDAKGCPLDSDGDGVYDGLDQCPDTPEGCTIDATGCPSDADGDGVCDGLDRCPHTPAGSPVNAQGCPTRPGALETGLLEQGTAEIGGVEFANAQGDLKPEVFPLLERLASILVQYPSLQFELGGYTDERGDASDNERLSLARAQAVLRYLLQKEPRLSAAQFALKGYGAGPSGPQSRRVVLRVRNTDVLRQEREKRQPGE
ncbi:MAG: hypothetical protein A2W00_08180 [Candidatus Eisenbacteria bacterium RBG_16_71_46]|nr:MAG: hypothetical protein A2W00_08180 [Candidatus Eisenbacteria bacterium RBG_16_71_46]